MEPTVAITGMGIISAIGRDVPAFTQALREGRSGIARLTHTPASEAIAVGAEIGPFSLRDHLAASELSATVAAQRALRTAFRAPFGIQTAVAAALEAWHAAKLDERPLAGERLGIVVGGQNLSQNLHYRSTAKYRKNPAYLSPRYALEFLDTNHVGMLSDIFRIRGEGFTVGGASAGGNVALIKGLQQIRAGIVDACLVIGALADLSPLELQGFYNIGALGGKQYAAQAQAACRPFDVDHEGFIYGQAAVCLILETARSARHRAVAAPVQLSGGAILLDGNRLTDPSAEGEADAMRAALAQAGNTPEQVDYINAHGSSSPLGDTTEIQAIGSVFGSHRPWINATKSLTGHCLYAAGAVEALATAVQLEHGFLHPNLNLERPIDSEARFVADQIQYAPLRLAISNSFGFGGINTSIVLTKRAG